MHNRGGVSKETTERILKAIEELNYQPNLMASRLKSTKEYLLAVLLPKATADIPFWNEHIVGVTQAEKEISSFDVYTKVFYFDQNSKTSFQEQVDEIIGDTFDGVFMVPVFYEESVKLITDCKERGVPCLLFDTNIPDQNTTCFIGQNAYDSGFLAAELFSYCLPSDSCVLIVNIVQEHDNYLQFDQREEGFRAFFDQLPQPHSFELVKMESRQGMKEEFEDKLTKLIHANPRLKGIFTVNGVQHIAPIVEKQNLTGLTLIGYDIIPQTIHYLQNGIINFIISQQPKIQAYNGIKLLYENVLLKKQLNKNYYLPIDIVMKSNLKYYTK
ncbi:substrate-binding domain-containing protein [Spirosoma sp. RP8]|uniref:Substrate-binding domain-containing protein n=1 Tax=Spirosoma liriopis TaxID=2937440 RepID=A0ABT0HRR7_9BACT|nr:substrate-binding domain-containing protein [Spirosoma liriopis]